MESNLTHELLKVAIGVIASVMSAALIGSFGGMIKMYIDVLRLRNDMNAAFEKIRELQEKEKHCGD